MADVTSPLNLDTLHLAEGKHDNPAAGMCVMEAVAMLAGEEFTDHPQCASPVIGAFLRSWNDTLPDGERQQLKQYITRLIGTRGDDALEARRAWMATDWLVRVHTPAWLRLAGLTEQADRLAGLAELTPESVPSIRPVIDAVRDDAAAAGDAAWAAAGDAAGDAAWAADWDAAGDAARAAAWAAAGDAAGDAARAAAWDAARAAARAAAWAAAGDAAGDAARAAARAALAPTVTELQAAAHQLVARMLEAS